MNIIGFNFTKIGALRKRAIVGTVNISNNITLNEITEAKIGIGEGERQSIRITFTFKSEYTPDLAAMSFEGDVLVLLEKKQAESLMAEWKEKKQLPSAIAQRVLNHILDRCSIQSLLLAKDLGLPSPVPLPKVNVQQTKPAETKPAEKKADEKKPAKKK